MKNRFCLFEEDGGGRRRDALNAWFSKQGLNDNEITRLLEQTLAQRKNIQLVKRCAKRYGFKLRGLVTNDKLELYFNLYKGKENICYISKGWGDPGFRIGDCIYIDKSAPRFKEKFYDIFKICSKELISVGILRQKGNSIPLSMEIGIYKDGFNAEVLKNAAETLEQVLKNISKIL